MNFITPSKSPKIKVFNYYPTPISQHLFPAGRQFVFTASVFGGAASRKNGKPWEKLPLPWEVSPTAGDFSPTAYRKNTNVCSDHKG